MERPVLALATSGPRADVGLLLPDGTFHVRALGEGAARGRGLLPAVHEVLEEARLAPSALGAIAVDVGPGSFTGTRVGVTTAKTLAFALSIPVVGVSSLRTLARAAPRDLPVLALRDAGRGSAYFAVYGSDRGGRLERVPPARGSADVVRAAQGDAQPVGEEAERLAWQMGLSGSPVSVAADARAVLEEALPRLREGDAGDPHALAPLYLQASTPEQRLRGEID